MPEQVNSPGVYIQEIPSGVHTITGIPTSITVFMGRALGGPVATEPGGGCKTIYSFGEYVQLYGELSHDAPMSYAVQDFFRNGGSQAVIARLVSADGQTLTPNDYVTAIENGVLDQVDIFNLLCIPPDNIDVPTDTAPLVWATAAAYCVRRRAMLILDSPAMWTTEAKQGNFGAAYQDTTQFELNAEQERNSIVYFPRVVEIDPLLKDQPGVFPPCGLIAGVIAMTDQQQGIWKAPAGINAGLSGVVSLEFTMNDNQNGILNPLGINCLRNFPVYGPVVWGARTLRGADQFEDDYKYVTVRRLTLYIEESIYRGTKWAAFEPNNESLWAQLRQSVGAFMDGLFAQGAFLGATAQGAYFVTCDATTTTPSDIEQGVVNIQIGFAPVTQAEFLVIQIQQQAGQTGS